MDVRPGVRESPKKLTAVDQTTPQYLYGYSSNWVDVRAVLAQHLTSGRLFEGQQRGWISHPRRIVRSILVDNGSMVV